MKGNLPVTGLPRRREEVWRGSKQFGERTVAYLQGRSSQPTGSSRCVLREAFRDLASSGQDGRWQKAPEHLFVFWLRVCWI